MLGDVTFKDAGWVEVAELVQDLIDKEYIIKRGFMGMQVEAQQVMYQNKAAMMLEGSWSVGPNDNPDGWNEGRDVLPDGAKWQRRANDALRHL